MNSILGSQGRVLSANSPTECSAEKQPVTGDGLRARRCGVPNAAAALGCRGGPVRVHPRSASGMLLRALVYRHRLASRAVYGALLSVLLLVQAGCGYSLSGRGSFLPAYIHRIGVPNFTNGTSIFDVDRRVTERVRSELLGRGKYVVVPETTGVDAILSGEILSITITPAAFNAQQQATRYALTLTAKVEFKDLKANKVLWANPAMQYREEFDVTTTTQALDPSAFFGQDVNALERIAGEFARSVVSAILEAF